LSGADDAHARAMDRIYRRQRAIYDLTRKYYLLGRDGTIAALDPPDGGTVLEIGCGTGRNLILAARRFPRARFHGVDISRAMLETAEAAVARAGLDGRIALAQGDAADFDPAAAFGVARFDRVFLSYTLSMIPPWREALDRAAGLVAPGGALHVVDFGPMDGLPGWFGRAMRAWLAKFEVSPRDDLGAAFQEAAGGAGLRTEFGPIKRGYAVAGVARAA
jgi:S-adenosylmethionine-diacylgycerolhomoserine-N-methlytransferase